MLPRRYAATVALCCATGTFAARAQSTPYEVALLPDDLTELSLDALLKIEVTSVSRRAEPLNEAAAAIFVVTSDDIRRIGAHSSVEALRIVPGLLVTRNDALAHTVIARGLGVDKLEVRLDGRSVYSPFTSTVFWSEPTSSVGSNA